MNKEELLVEFIERVNEELEFVSEQLTLLTDKVLEIDSRLTKAEIPSEESTGIICKVWDGCPHPNLCQDKCFDKDLVSK